MSSDSPWRAPEDSEGLPVSASRFASLELASRLVQVQQVFLITASLTVTLASIGLLFLSPEVLVGGDVMGDSMGGLALSLILVLGGLGMVAGALLGVPIWGYWHHTAATNLQALGRAGHHTPAAHVYWWFVPFANLWMPYRTTKELVVHSHPDNEGLPIGGFDPALDDAEEATAPLVGTLPLWWGLHLVSNILTNAAGRMDRTSQRGSDLSFVNDSMTTLSALAVGVDLAGTLLGLGAVVLYLRIVRQVTADQEELASSMDTAPTGYAG